MRHLAYVFLGKAWGIMLHLGALYAFQPSVV
jgi:hypothetical protein